MAGKKIGELTPLGRNLIASDELELSLTGSAGSRKITGAQIIGAAGEVTSVTGTSPVVSSGGATPVISMPVADASGNNGYLTSSKFITFSNKQEALVSGTNIKTINSTSLLGSGNIVIAAGRPEVRLTTATIGSTTAAAGASQTALFSANIFQAGGQAIDVDFSYYTTITGVNTQMRVYLSNTSTSIIGQPVVDSFNITPVTLGDGARYCKRWFTGIDTVSGQASVLIPNSTNTSLTDLTMTQTTPFSTYILTYPTNPFIIIALNQGAKLLGVTITY